MAEQVRIQVGDKVIEVTGEAFADRFADAISYMVGLLQIDQPAISGISELPPAHGIVPSSPAREPALDDFGEVLQRLPNDVTATDQMLVAGLFAQRMSEENVFATRDASQLLLEQGVKVGNPSQCMTNNLKAKRVFKIGSKYRLSRAGVDYANELGASL